jgi:hypothetical protein
MAMSDEVEQGKAKMSALVAVSGKTFWSLQPEATNNYGR